MIALVGTSAIALSLLQASIAAPTTAFRGCLRDAATKAKTEKVSGDKIEDYLRNSCTVQMGTLKEALIAFRLKNGMGRKAAISDADMTVDDYVSTPADNYKFIVQLDSQQGQPQQASAAKPAAQSTPQPPKP